MKKEKSKTAQATRGKEKKGNTNKDLTLPPLKSLKQGMDDRKMIDELNPQTRINMANFGDDTGRLDLADDKIEVSGLEKRFAGGCNGTRLYRPPW